MREIICQPKEAIHDYVQRIIGFKYPYHNFTALGLLNGMDFDAGVIYESFTEREGGYQDCSMHVAITGRLSKDFLKAAFDYPFNQLGCVRVTGKVPANNHKAIKFDEHLGFTLEATIQRALPDCDLLIYRMFREDCRWIDD